MIAYARDEIVPATEFARSFSAIYKSLVEHKKEKIAVSKNNKLELVMLPIDEYERMRAAYDLLEHMEIYRIVKERENQPTISFEEMMAKFGITEDDLRD
ncbi:MAG TPA: prevent-host-death protein [Campylobacterales bacterium]|nr:prevent-host-death protein [Campylobacterales bacterium]